VLDIVQNPGEEVFLAVFKDNKVSLYAKFEKEPKMIFEQ